MGLVSYVYLNIFKQGDIMKNVGNVDRIIRIMLGLIIAAWGVWAENWLGLIAIVPIATALVRVCPAYLPFKINTCKTE